MPGFESRRAVLLGLLSLALLQLGSGTWLLLKAELAQVLIQRSWQAGVPSRPWPWADTWPVARLQLSEDADSLYVLADSGGEGLAFGPTLLSMQHAQATVIAGHRDTHFTGLEDLELGGQVRLQRLGGETRSYLVESIHVVDSRHARLIGNPGELLLVSCYPFNAMDPGGPLRYVVRALPQFIPNAS